MWASFVVSVISLCRLAMLAIVLFINVVIVAVPLKMLNDRFHFERRVSPAQIGWQAMSSTSLANIFLYPTSKRKDSASNKSLFQTILPSLKLSTRYTNRTSEAGDGNAVSMYVSLKLNGMSLRAEEWMDSGLIRKIRSYFEMVIILELSAQSKAGSDSGLSRRNSNCASTQLATFN